MKYEKPDLEELDLVLEGSYLLAATGDQSTDKGDTDWGGGDDGNPDAWD